MAYPSLSAKVGDYDIPEIKKNFGASAGTLIACYCGNIGFQTDFDTFFAAAESLGTASIPIHFVIAGSGPREDELRARASNMANVTVPGWLSGTELAELFHVSSFGLIGFFNITDYMSSLPNKFSEYLSAGLALVCGTTGEMERWITKFDCGITYESMSSVSLGRSLTKLSANRSDLERIKNNAKNLHKSHFDLDVIIPRIADHTESVAFKEKR
jgi:glycosyltransferase involved in cell wall biosynthesis